jgi:hypothetical protein
MQPPPKETKQPPETVVGCQLGLEKEWDLQ